MTVDVGKTVAFHTPSKHVPFTARWGTRKALTSYSFHTPSKTYHAQSETGYGISRSIASSTGSSDALGIRVSAVR